jgi:leader peptidase (prepilin peptidase) / N-methyltransferase
VGADSPVVAVLAGIAGAILGLAADRLAVRWPEHDPEDAEHPAARPLGWRTVVVVATSAIAFALPPARFAGDPVALLLFGAWFVTLVIGLATDLDQRLLPDVLTLPVIPVALVYAVGGLNPLVADGWIGAVLAGIAIPAVLYLPSIPFGAGAFGMGDVKLLAGTGLMLGLTRAVGGVLSGLLLAGVVLVLLLAARRIGRRSYVPFGPFLIIGALWAVLILQPA